ncbi:MAG TPA: hypothetical protein VGC41_25040 [Kofleriaceae bacterium]
MKVAVVVLLLAGTAFADPKAKPRSPHGVTKIQIDYAWMSFSSDKWNATLTWDGAAFVSDKKKKKVDPALVEALYTAVNGGRTEPEPRSCISHTDDYPHFQITIEGDEPLTFGSDSNCHAYIPWNITRGAKLSVQYTGDAWKGLAPLLAATDEKWKKAGNSPMASTGLGGERVDLGSYIASKGSSGGDAPACAKSFETSPQVKVLFGDGIKVEEVYLGCDLGSSADCSAASATMLFGWQGIRAQLDVPCTGGVVGRPAALNDQIGEVKKLLASKPVRALVRNSTDPVRLYWNQGWHLDGGMTNVDWEPKTTTMNFRWSGQTPATSLWADIGIDVKALTKKNYGWLSVDVKLDFTGKIVK